MAYFPMMVNIEKTPVLVVGGGKEGEGKVEVLHRFGAIITLVATDATKEAIALSDSYFRRPFSDDDIHLADFSLVVAATDDRMINKRVSNLAKKYKIPVNVVDDVELCTFIFPAIVKENDLVCAISSSGKSPYITQYVKAMIYDNLPGNIGAINDRMGEYREQAKKEFPDAEKRRAFLREKLDELLRD